MPSNNPNCPLCFIPLYLEAIIVGHPGQMKVYHCLECGGDFKTTLKDMYPTKFEPVRDFTKKNNYDN